MINSRSRTTTLNICTYVSFRYKNKLNLKTPLTIKKGGNTDYERPLSALKHVKSKMKHFQGNAMDSGSKTSLPKLPAHLSYMFALPEEASLAKEKRMNNFLNQIGIFQIHLNAILAQEKIVGL